MLTCAHNAYKDENNRVDISNTDVNDNDNNANINNCYCDINFKMLIMITTMMTILMTVGICDNNDHKANNTFQNNVIIKQ